MEMEVIVERCAFLDVHRDTVMACARTPDGRGGRSEDVTEFGTTTSQLLLLADWLAERKVTLVGMEATGVYWKPVHWVLEASVPEVWVINARHMRNLLRCIRLFATDLGGFQTAWVAGWRVVVGDRIGGGHGRSRWVRCQARRVWSALVSPARRAARMALPRPSCSSLGVT